MNDLHRDLLKEVNDLINPTLQKLHEIGEELPEDVQELVGKLGTDIDAAHHDFATRMIALPE